ncbi:MAG: hypothetical protein ABIJ59_13255 [Pseudomonadota bacterium]
MESIYIGLTGKNSYVFGTNDIYGTKNSECAIARINRHCGALIVTAKGDFLIRLNKILEECFENLSIEEEGISIDLAKKIIHYLEEHFRKDSKFKSNPLPFLLLLVGFNLENSERIEHIFLRHRVIKIEEVKNKKIYTTQFDFQEPVCETDLFYGFSELSEYISGQILEKNAELEKVMRSVYFSLVQTQQMDSSLLPGIRMATLSESNGFEWVDEKVLDQISNQTEKLCKKLKGEMQTFLKSEAK